MFLLENGIHCLLIQDNNHNEEANGDAMAYCSLAVNVGSYNDPPDRPGLAHFLEHMIFMGSKEYDNEDDYSNHVSAFGGCCNAYTVLKWTNCQFQIAYQGLEELIEVLEM